MVWYSNLFKRSVCCDPHSPRFSYSVVVRDVLGTDQLVGGQVFAQLVLGCAAKVHEGLGHHATTITMAIREPGLGQT